jgi:hypothetical protein
LFFSYKANLPLTGTHREDLSRLQKNVNTIVEKELKDKVKKQLD